LEHLVPWNIWFQTARIGRAETKEVHRMSRKHFELIAETLRESLDSASSVAEKNDIERVARRFARNLAATNPRFDGHRFLRACGIEV
jgi:hypothetical protein